MYDAAAPDPRRWKALVLLCAAPQRTGAILVGVRDWLSRNAMKIAAVIATVLALVLLRKGIAGLV